MYRRARHQSWGLFLAVAVLVAASAQTLLDPISIKAIIEIEQPNQSRGRDNTQLISADRVVSGDIVIYTLEVRNTAANSVPRPTLTYAIPAHMSYTPDSAVGPGADVTFSVDEGRSFNTPEKLYVAEPGGQQRAAAAADYTHIRWQMKNALKGNSVAFVRFRARMK